MAFTRRRWLQWSALFALGACAAPKRTQLVFWTMQLKPNFTAYMEALIAQFQAKGGMDVEWIDVPWSEMEQKILAALSGGDVPDVVNLNPQFASKVAEKGALVDMSTVVSAQDRARYFPNLWQANQLGALTFGIPWYVATDITLYNRSIFRQAGLDRAPQTYRELAQAAAQIKAKTGKYAFFLTMDGGQVLESMVQMGMPLFRSDGKAGFNNALGQKAFQYWVDLFQQALIPREILTEGHRRAGELYQGGEIALLLTGPQFLKSIVVNAPDIAKETDVAPQIIGDTGKKSAAVMNVVIPQRSNYPSQALSFALFLTNDQNQLRFSQIQNSLPSTHQAAADRYFSQGRADSLLDRARSISAAQLAQSEVLIPPRQNLDSLQKIIYAELQMAMLAQKPVPEAVRAAADQWNSL